jgi:hypothetical protein
MFAEKIMLMWESLRTVADGNQAYADGGPRIVSTPSWSRSNFRGAK